MTRIFIQRERQYSIARFVILSKPLLNESGNTPVDFTSFIILPGVQLVLLYRCYYLVPIILLYACNWKGGRATGGWKLRCDAQAPRPAFCFVFSFVSFETHEFVFSLLFSKNCGVSHPKSFI